MRLHGYFDQGFPLIRGLVQFSQYRLAPLRVEFIIDTGADTTVLMPVPAMQMGFDYDKVADSEKIETLHFCGEAVVYKAAANLIFEADTHFCAYAIDAEIALLHAPIGSP